MSAPSYQLKADFCTTLGYLARTRVLELLGRLRAGRRGDAAAGAA